jgi:hypothetical protein
MWHKLKIFVLLAATVLWTFGSIDRALGVTVELADIDSGLTSPTGDYRWRDVADQLYNTAYRDTYNYTQALVQVIFDAVDRPLHGTLTAFNLKPNFAYQLKLVGTHWTSANERIGLAGRWWQEMWDGADWSDGKNLNHKGDGSSPNPNDLVYFFRRDLTNPGLIDPKNLFMAVATLIPETGQVPWVPTYSSASLTRVTWTRTAMLTAWIWQR